MLDVPTWVWQVVAAIGGGLGLGVGLGALMQRGRKRSPRGAPGAPPPTAPRAAARAQAETDEPPAARAEREDDTPQHRLLERQREQTSQLAAQLRAQGEAHARELGARTQECQAERLRAQRELEALRQAHSEELAHLMTVLVEQVDRIHQLHAGHVRQLENEIARSRAGKPPRDPAGPVDTGPTGARVAEAARLPRHAAPELTPLEVDNPPVPAATATPAPRLAPPRAV